MADLAAPNIAEIQAIVCAHFGIALGEMRAHRRDRAVAHPRQVALYFCRRLTDHSLPAIGRMFDRDHSTVRHAVIAVERRIDRDPELAAAVAAIAGRLAARAHRNACRCPACLAERARFPLDPPQLLLPISWPGELRLEAREAA